MMAMPTVGRPLPLPVLVVWSSLVVEGWVVFDVLDVLDVVVFDELDVFVSVLEGVVLLLPPQPVTRVVKIIKIAVKAVIPFGI